MGKAGGLTPGGGRGGRVDAQVSPIRREAGFAVTEKGSLTLRFILILHWGTYCTYE